jgi:hypothetical protein
MRPEIRELQAAEDFPETPLSVILLYCSQRA